MENNVHYLRPCDARIDRHHLLFDRPAWTSSRLRGYFRHHTGLIVPLERAVHNAIHTEVEIVPLPDNHTLAHARDTFEAVPGDYVATVENLCEAIDDATLHPRASRLQRQLGELTVAALELQLPFLKEGQQDGAA